MSHGYSMYFTTKDGKFMGCWAIQEHFTRAKIEEIKKDYPHAFKGDFYETLNNYDIIEIEYFYSYWFKQSYNVNSDIKEGINYAIKNQLRMFLG